MLYNDSFDIKMFLHKNEIQKTQFFFELFITFRFTIHLCVKIFDLMIKNTENSNGKELLGFTSYFSLN